MESSTTIKRNDQIGGHKSWKRKWKSMDLKYEHNYDDIINMPHHVSKKHPRMSLEARSAQFAPFAALTGYEDEIYGVSRYADN